MFVFCRYYLYSFLFETIAKEAYSIALNTKKVMANFLIARRKMLVLVGSPIKSSKTIVNSVKMKYYCQCYVSRTPCIEVSL